EPPTRTLERLRVAVESDQADLREPGEQRLAVPAEAERSVDEDRAGGRGRGQRLDAAFQHDGYVPGRAGLLSPVRPLWIAAWLHFCIRIRLRADRRSRITLSSLVAAAPRIRHHAGQYSIAAHRHRIAAARARRGATRATRHGNAAPRYAPMGRHWKRRRGRRSPPARMYSRTLWNRGRGFRTRVSGWRPTAAARRLSAAFATLARSLERRARSGQVRRHPPEQIVLVQVGEGRFLLGDVAVPGRRVPQLEVRVRADHGDLLGQAGVLAQRGRQGDPALLVEGLFAGARVEHPQVVADRAGRGERSRRRGAADPVGRFGERRRGPHRKAPLLPL